MASLAACCFTPVGGPDAAPPIPDAGQSGCTIDGSFYASGALDPVETCHICNPSLSTTAWSAAMVCGTGSFCSGGACVAGCSIGGANFADRSNNPENLLQCCNARRAPSDWTARLDDGGFYSFGNGAGGITAADFDMDEWPDLAISTSDGLAVLQNLQGTFSGGYVDGGSLGSDGLVAAQDLSGDGRPDLIIGGPIAPLQTWITRDGGFDQNLLGWGVNFPAFGDLDGDGVTDIIGADLGEGAVAVWKGLGGGVFAPSPILFPSSSAAGIHHIAPGDFRGLGILDVVVAQDIGRPRVGLYLNDGLGALQPEQTISTLTPDGLVAADLNDDGHLDLAFSDYLGGVNILLGNGDGTFQASFTVDTHADAGIPGGYGDIVAARLDTSPESNARPAIVGIRQDGVSILWPAHDASYAPVLLALPSYPTGLATADFNRDGATDVAVSILMQQGPGGVQVLLNGCP